jgi:hypothetical protein
MANQIKTRWDLFLCFRSKYVNKKSPTFIKSVTVYYSPEFREKISECLQEILGIERLENLNPKETGKFEKEVDLWYNHVPFWWNESSIKRDVRAFKRHHEGWLSREIHLGENDYLPNRHRVHVVINFARLNYLF